MRPWRCRASGAAAYLDADAVIAAATDDRAATPSTPATAFWPNAADFARQCAEAGLTFVGPDVGDIWNCSATRRAPGSPPPPRRVPVIRGLDHAVTLDEARAFFASLAPGGAMIIKARRRRRRARHARGH